MPERRTLFPIDNLLRRHGWQIAGRPRAGETLWCRGEVVLGQADALERLPAREVVEALKETGEYHLELVA